ncbi:hypothetical protein O3S80_14730 [Streptomyces sp. Lzd4kr]|nr:hypothetical protein [Streptomyces sp. Lzd4kr]
MAPALKVIQNHFSAVADRRFPGPDPLHLADVFGFDEKIATRYAETAREPGKGRRALFIGSWKGAWPGSWSLEK